MKKLLSIFIIVICLITLYGQAGLLDPDFDEIGIVTTLFQNGDVLAGSKVATFGGKILVAGTVESDSTERDFAIAHYNENGSLVTTFKNKGKFTYDFIGKDDHCFDVSYLSDGKILLTGLITGNNHNEDMVLLKLNQDGTFDDSFGTNGKVIIDYNNGSDAGKSILIQDDGKIIVIGYISKDLVIKTCVLFRFNKDGALDKTFGDDGVVTTDVTGGYLNPKFSILQSDGKILLGGSVSINFDSGDVLLQRFNSDGTVDESFGDNGVVQTDFNDEDESAYSGVLQSDNKILVAVGVKNSNGRDFELIRYNINGSIDVTFGNNGRVVTDFGNQSNISNSVIVQEDGKILLSGLLGTTPYHDFALARYNIDGTLDTGFGLDGKVTTDFGYDELAFSMTIQADNKIVLVGESTDNSGMSSFAIARYLSGIEKVDVLNPVIKDYGILVYPNPTDSELYINYTSKEDFVGKVLVYDLLGNKLLEKEVKFFASSKNLVDISSITNGVYIFTIKDKDNKLIKTRKVVINRIK